MTACSAALRLAAVFRRGRVDMRDRRHCPFFFAGAGMLSHHGGFPGMYFPMWRA